MSHIWPQRWSDTIPAATQLLHLGPSCFHMKKLSLGCVTGPRALLLCPALCLWGLPLESSVEWLDPHFWGTGTPAPLGALGQAPPISSKEFIGNPRPSQQPLFGPIPWAMDQVDVRWEYHGTDLGPGVMGGWALVPMRAVRISQGQGRSDKRVDRSWQDLGSGGALWVMCPAWCPCLGHRGGPKAAGPGVLESGPVWVGGHGALEQGL